MLLPKKIDVVIPVFNEEECLPVLLDRLLVLRNSLAPNDARFIFINDGSKDASPKILSDYAAQYPFISVLHFSRNFGHQIAITAGIDYATNDYVAIIDADLQDSPELIKDMFIKAEEGYDIVYAKRLVRKGESWFKRFTAKTFYWLISKMCDVTIPTDTGDFRLISQRVAVELRRIRERHRFVRGLVPWVGFSSVAIMYNRDPRYAGETKYSLGKMIKFSKDAIFSFSNTPLKLASFVGYVITGVGVLGAIFMLYIKLFTNLAVPGITATLVTIVVVGGMQIIMLGIVGEYIGRIFEEIKGRPLYIISDAKNIAVSNDVNF